MKGDRLGIGVRDLEVLEVGVDVGVQVQLVLFDELHHGSGGEHLADRAYTEERLVGDDGRMLLQVSVAVALGEEQLAVLDNRDRSPRDMITLQLRAHDAIEEVFQFLGVDEFAGLRLIWPGRRILSQSPPAWYQKEQRQQNPHAD